MRPRRRVADAPPAPADPAPWLTLFGGARLDVRELSVLMRLAVRKTIPSGEVVLAAQRPARALVALLSGDVVMGSRAADGSLRTERSVAGPAWLDLSAAWLSVTHEMEAVALSDVVLAELDFEALRAELLMNPALSLRFCASLARQVHELTTATRNLLHNDAPARFAQWLLQRCPEGNDVAEMRLQERKRDIAQQLAMTPETLSRLMRSFESRALIEVRGYHVRVLDVAALKAVIADNQP